MNEYELAEARRCEAGHHDPTCPTTQWDRRRAEDWWFGVLDMTPRPACNCWLAVAA